MKISHLVYVICIILIPVQLFGQVRVILHQPPPNQLKIEQLWWVDISNFSTNEYTVYLRTEIVEDEAGLIHSPYHPEPNGYRRKISRMSVTCGMRQNTGNTSCGPVRFPRERTRSVYM
jgi:hypothetical protein